MRKVLLDQGLAPRAAKLLRAEGWEALHVGEAGLDRADDSDILEFARQRGMACVTLDHDFHTHLALALSTSPSVIMLPHRGADRRGAGRSHQGRVGRLWESHRRGRRGVHRRRCGTFPQIWHLGK